MPFTAVGVSPHASAAGAQSGSTRSSAYGRHAHDGYAPVMALENERYVLDLCDKILSSVGVRQHRFDWLRGGPPPRTDNRRALPVDAYYPTKRLVIEFHEKQHTEAVKHFDKPDMLTVSGVHRGIQRRIYDDRHRELIPAHGLSLVIIPMSDFTVRGGSIVTRREAGLTTVSRAHREHLS